MADAFNPYREWLGLPDYLTRPNCYQLLGLADGEPDEERITLAADRAMTKVRGFRPGTQAKAWSQLLDEIYSAKTTLLDPGAKAQYDRRLEAGESDAPSTADLAPSADDRAAAVPRSNERYPPGMGHRGSPPPAAREQPAEQPQPAEPQQHQPAPQYAPAAQAAPLARPYVPMAYPHPGYAPLAYPAAGYPLAYAPQAPFASPPAPPQYPPEAAAHFGGQALDPMAPVSIPGVNRIVGFAGAPDLLPPAAPAGIPVGVAVPAASQPESASPLETAVPRASVSASIASAGSRQAQGSQRTMLLVALVGGIAAIGGVLIYLGSLDKEPAKVAQNVSPDKQRELSTKPQPTPSVSPAPQPQPIPPVALPPQPAITPLPEVPAPQPPLPDPAPAPLPAPEPAPPAPASLPEPPPPTPAPVPAPIPVPAPEPAPPPMTRAELAALGKSLTMARAAIGEQNFDEADRFIAQADEQAKLPEHRAMVARLKEIAGYVKQFRAAVEQAARGFEAGETFKVGSSTQVAIVETLPDKIIIRSAGQNKVYPFADLPPGLAVVIADFSLDGADPVGRVVKGAFYSVSKGDRQLLDAKAKIWWEEAQLGGVELTHLMPFLTDKYDLEKQPPAAEKSEP